MTHGAGGPSGLLTRRAFHGSPNLWSVSETRCSRSLGHETRGHGLADLSRCPRSHMTAETVYVETWPPLPSAAYISVMQVKVLAARGRRRSIPEVSQVK